jgi:hypothetical protein
MIKTNRHNNGGSEIWCTPDMEQWKRQRNACIHKASDILQQHGTMQSGWSTSKDWGGGSLYVTTSANNDTRVGQWNKTAVWQWDGVAIKNMCNNIDMDVLTSAMEWNPR